MEKPKTIKINNVNYYDSKELKKYHPIFFYGCSDGISLIIKKKKIPASDYIFITNNKRKGLSIYDYESRPRRSKLLISEKWIEENHPKFNGSLQNEENTTVKKSIKIKVRKKNKTKNKTKAVVKSDEIQEAPPLLILEDNEKFKDENGNPVEIETRGIREPNGIYFLAKDVSVVFEMISLNKVLMKEGEYFINEHYKTFITCKNGFKKQLFITYLGMIKIITSSRSYITKNNIYLLLRWLHVIVPIYNINDELLICSFNFYNTC